MNAIFTLFSTPYGYLMGILSICTTAIIRCGMKEANKRVVVGMSGGIDSTATCLMLQEQGNEIVGVTMRVWGDDLLFVCVLFVLM